MTSDTTVTSSVPIINSSEVPKPSTNVVTNTIPVTSKSVHTVVTSDITITTKPDCTTCDITTTSTKTNTIPTEDKKINSSVQTSNTTPVTTPAVPTLIQQTTTPLTSAVPQTSHIITTFEGSAAIFQYSFTAMVFGFLVMPF